MMQIVLIGISAGAASALLFSALASGKAYSIGLFYLTPLPILLAGIGWSHLAGLVAASAAAIALGIILGRWYFLIFLIGIGIPSYVLAYLSLLARPAGPNGEFEWFPPGQLVLAAAILAAASTALTIPALGYDIESYRAALKNAFEQILRLQAGTPADEPLKLPNGEDPAPLLELMALVMPIAAAVFSMITNLANLWLAGRIARVSGRLGRPWPDLSAMKFPAVTPFVFLGAIAISFVPGLLGVVAALFAATLFMAYVILGLAVIHGATRFAAMRGPILAAVWTMVLLLGWTVILTAILGLIDGIFDFRGRAARRNPPNLPTQTPKE